MIELLVVRYEYDGRGRIVAPSTDGPCPRFVLVRAAEGCAWRVAATVPEPVVARVSRLAGREGPLGATRPGVDAAPERLEMIRRLLAEAETSGRAVGERRELSVRGEAVEEGGVPVGELWTIAPA